MSDPRWTSLLVSHLLLGCPWPNCASIPPGPGHVWEHLGSWGDLVGGYDTWTRSKSCLTQICVMHSHAETSVVIIFPSRICPGGNIKLYYLIELKWGWELPEKFFEVPVGFVFYIRNRTIRPGMFTTPLSPPRLGCVDPVQCWEAAQEDVT